MNNTIHNFAGCPSRSHQKCFMFCLFLSEWVDTQSGFVKMNLSNDIREANLCARLFYYSSNICETMLSYQIEILRLYVNRRRYYSPE